MTRLSCLIVDDEPIAREIIQTYCRHLPYLHVLGSCGNALEAKMILQKEKVDILFLDINMPVMDGMSFLKTIKNPPQVIFTTAYKEYALDAFDLAATDYLLKPFSLERFIIAVDKATEKIQAPAAGFRRPHRKIIMYSSKPRGKYSRYRLMTCYTLRQAAITRRSLPAIILLCRP